MTTSQLDSLKRLAKSIPVPDSYFAGVEGVPRAIPRNVLQFHRHHSQYLGNSTTPSLHHRLVLIANLDAPGCVVLDGSAISITKGQGLLIFPFQSHHYTQLDEGKDINWLFTTFEYENPSELESLRDTAFTYDSLELERLHDLSEAFALHARHAAIPLGSAPLQLALLLSSLIQRQQRYVADAGGSPSITPPNMPFLKTVSLFIHRNLHRDLTPDEIAREAHLSVSRLRSKFKQVLGMSLGRYISETRMQKARSLLHSTDLTVTQIAESCGYESLFAFSRAFKRVTGMSPRTFTKTTRSENA